MRQKEASPGEITPKASPPPHAIWLFDRDPAYRKRVKLLLTEKGHKVVCHKSVEALWTQCNPPACSCILCETSCGEGSDGAGVMDELSSRGWRIPVVFLANPCRVPQIVRLMNAGAIAVVGKTDSPDELFAMVDHALAEAERMRKQEKIARSLAAKMELLSKRELEVVKLVAIGMKNQDIADHLGLALITVKTHRANAMRKLEAGNIVQLTQIVIVAGLIDPAITEGIVDLRHNGKKAKPQASPPSKKRGKRKKP